MWRVLLLLALWAWQEATWGAEVVYAQLIHCGVHAEDHPGGPFLEIAYDHPSQSGDIYIHNLDAANPLVRGFGIELTIAYTTISLSPEVSATHEMIYTEHFGGSYKRITVAPIDGTWTGYPSGTRWLTYTTVPWLCETCQPGVIQTPKYGPWWISTYANDGCWKYCAREHVGSWQVPLWSGAPTNAIAQPATWTLMKRLYR